MAEDILLVEKNDNICSLTLNRPEKRNSLSPALVGKLLQTFSELSQEDSVRVVVLRGTGDKAFCSGYDLRALSTGDRPSGNENQPRSNPVEELFQSIINFPYPVIGMLNGHAFGAGCELAICCDIRIGANHLCMGMPPAKLGLVYPWSGLQRFIQIIGLSSAKEMFFTGRTYDGNRLKELGLIDYLVPKQTLAADTLQLAQEIAANAPLALKGTKRIFNMYLNAKRLQNNEISEAESLFVTSFESEDLKEGQKAFLKKRKPQFKGR